ncbi:MAG: hypothetical protein CMJ74_01395 [Planctomycetaceae bacterium]|nr:hypothetical protein [Planctomycetaceae bacterium]
MKHQQLQQVGGLSLLFLAFLLIVIAAWTSKEKSHPSETPPILGSWTWYGGTMQVKDDGTCHWQGADHEEHGTWTKAEGYFFDWGEKGNDYNHLSVNATGQLSGRFIKWGGELRGTRPERMTEK